MGLFLKASPLAVVLSLALLLTCEGEQPSRGPERRYSTARMGPDDCSAEDVAVYQNSANPLPSGMPTYTVQIINTCGGCRVSNVHVACGNFASTELVDPATFQRVGFNDCIVKGGAPMEPSETISFHYSNSFSYSLSVASVSCAE
ncbi:hypothetical protein EJB05_22373 [Eragrostis curvula]|uniref:Uncharacterized protein n=1 Tax=Eragrostis curvula TaxID=38414 RepID=A0A5J9V5R1_9POAL|nr:hypothetical protein EJB05_22373 [Eragrostis curvula]